VPRPFESFPVLLTITEINRSLSRVSSLGFVDGAATFHGQECGDSIPIAETEHS
jgi:hypothetical protein